METLVFLIGAAVILAGAAGVVLSANTTRAVLSLIGTLFGIAVLFVAHEAHFLAAVQVIVYAGAIVVLFLFVLMLLGVDTAEDLSIEPIAGQRPAALAGGGVFLAMVLIALSSGSDAVTGVRGTLDPATGSAPDVVSLGRSLFTTHVFALEATALLLTIAVVGAVVLVRKSEGPAADEPGAADDAGKETA
ncbi:MAG: NADH-quinone oxidoreductase subunit J [Acidimicrobiales bacterium]|nr:NADH-quinone oxidoreductase subunit J [Acidimicrobiales bacterium]